jgi:hypothetical protein
VRWKGLLLAAVVAGLAVPSGAGAATNTPYDRNLLKNAGAESGPGGNGYQDRPIPRWTKHVPPFAVARYGSAGFPTTSESDRIHGGAKFFTCGPFSGYPNDTQAFLDQDMDLVGRNAAIDSGHVVAIVKGWVATFSDDDFGEIEAIFRRTSGEEVGARATTPVTQGTNGRFRFVSAATVVPKFTRHIQVGIRGFREQGAYCDFYADNVSLVLIKI